MDVTFLLAKCLLSIFIGKLQYPNIPRMVWSQIVLTFQEDWAKQWPQHDRFKQVAIRQSM